MFLTFPVCSSLYQVLESEVFSELRNVGACYWHGRDRKMRPLLVVSLQRLQQLQREAGEEKVTRIVVFCLEFFLRWAAVPLALVRRLAEASCTLSCHVLALYQSQAQEKSCPCRICRCIQCCADTP